MNYKTAKKEINNMTFTILMCTRNSADKIGEVLNSIINQTCKTDITEVIVVDYQSSVDTLEIAMKELLKCNINSHVFSIEKSGKCAALEYGFDKAIGDYILILDDDNILFPEFIQNAKIILKNNTDIGCLGSQGIADASLQYPVWFEKYQSHFAIGLPKQVGKADWVWGAASIVKREAWNLLRNGGFSFKLNAERISSSSAPTNGGGEDVELALAIKLLGYNIDFSTNLKFVHKFDQKRLNEYFVVKNNWAIVRSVAVHEMYRAFIYYPNSTFSYYTIWQVRFWKKVLSSIINLIRSYLLAYPKIDRQMNYTTLAGMLSGYIQFSAMAPNIFNGLKKINQIKFIR
jgi:glycosyltransferase involved in cell wall biosynthesis